MLQFELTNVEQEALLKVVVPPRSTYFQAIRSLEATGLMVEAALSPASSQLGVSGRHVSSV